MCVWQHVMVNFVDHIKCSLFIRKCTGKACQGLILANCKNHGSVTFTHLVWWGKSNCHTPETSEWTILIRTGCHYEQQNCSDDVDSSGNAYMAAHLRMPWGQCQPVCWWCQADPRIRWRWWRWWTTPGRQRLIRGEGRQWSQTSRQSSGRTTTRRAAAAGATREEEEKASKKRPSLNLQCKSKEPSSWTVNIDF